MIARCTSSGGTPGRGGVRRHQRACEETPERKRPRSDEAVDSDQDRGRHRHPGKRRWSRRSGLEKCSSSKHSINHGQPSSREPLNREVEGDHHTSAHGLDAAHGLTAGGLTLAVHVLLNLWWEQFKQWLQPIIKILQSRVGLERGFSLRESRR